MNDFGAEPEELIRQEIAACERVIRSGWYILGSEVENFERLWAQKCQSRFAVGTGNGMDAIEIGLRTLGLGEGDEVITTAMTAFATVLGILRADASPVLADINEGDALLDIDSVRRCVSPRTKAVLLVHLYGQVPDMSVWKHFCAETGILLLEDCAQAHLATDGGKGAGTFGPWGAFSFYPTKNLGAIGDGGALVTDSEEIAEKAKRMRNYGQRERYHHPDFGLNSRLDELQAAILATRLHWLEQFSKRRREIAKSYHSSIRNPKIELLAPPRSEESHVHHLFVVRCKERDRLLQHLKDQSITSLIHYPVPIHQQDPTRHLRIDPEGLLRSENHATTCLSIPCHPQMDEAAVHGVVEALNSFR
jgi:dTDP-4-amino-4,6-dideoxygalactose transaminase